MQKESSELFENEENPEFILSVKSLQQLAEIWLTFINFIRFKSWPVQQREKEGINAFEQRY